MSGGQTTARIAREVERLWGKPLGTMDLEICEVLGWIRLTGKGRAQRWCLAEKLKGYNGQIHRNGELPGKGQLKVDGQIFDFLLHYQRGDLDPFLTRSDFRLRIILTLVDLEISGLAVRQVGTDGTLDFAAATQIGYADNTRIKQFATLRFLISAVKAFSRYGYIQLAHAGRAIPSDLPDFIVRTIKSAKHQPIWVPTGKLPKDLWDIFEQMKPTLRGKKIEWRHTPARQSATGRKK